jgi:hypothetical protein
VGEAFVTRFEGKGPEGEIVKDMARRALYATPVLVLVFGLIWGVDGALSTLFAIGLVLVNFALSAAILSWSARISLGLLMGAALFGFLVRMGLILAAVLLVRNQPWVAMVPLALTIVITHLGLLFWEMRYVSASLAFPGLKPALPVSPYASSSRSPIAGKKESTTS